MSFPSASKDSDAAFLVVTGVDRPVSECTPANDYEGCIVQRRLIHYVKHTPLNLPITMWLVCKNVKCNVDSTCARTGKCVSARIEDPEACAGGDCYPEGDKPPAPGDEAGATDGPTEDGPTEDGPIGDGGPGDAKPDSITDANKPDAVVIPPLPPGNNLFCPPLEAGCAPAGVCCYSRTGSGGMCGPPACNGEQITMHCSRKADCPGAGEFCCGALGAVADPIQVELAQQPGKPANQLVQTPVPVGSGLVSTSCAATCPSTTTGRWVCVVGEGGNCPAGLTCQNDPSAFYQPSAFGTLLAAVA